MKALFFILLFLLPFLGWSQQEFNFWASAELKGDLVKKTDWSAEMTSRFDRNGLATLFPQVGIEYKVKKWFKPGIEYRFVTNRNKIGNFKASHRLNFNLNFKQKIAKRLEASYRIRYQYAFDRLNPTVEYDAEFDQAIRLKAKFEYDIKGFSITPAIGNELYINPGFDPYNRHLTKNRFALEAGWDSNSKHGISLKYNLDKRLDSYKSNLRHIVALSYSYKL